MVVAEYFRVPSERLLVVVDDADLPLGEIRLRPLGSSGGHHGLESIEQRLGTRAYARLRIGIGTPQPGRDVTGYVLGKFTKEEQSEIEFALTRAAEAAALWTKAGTQQCMNQYNAS